MKIILFFITLSVLTAGCDKLPDKTKPKVNITGSYSGIIPCADCEGIYYLLTLNPDTTYNEKMVYIGKDASPLENKGKYFFTDTNKIKFINKDGPVSQFLISNGSLIMLDANGRNFEGPAADKFILKPGIMKMPEKANRDSSKTSSTSVSNSINGKWTLSEINGKKVDANNYTNGLPFLEIREADNKFSGSTGCNRINGASTIVGNEVVFTKYITTRMACPGSGESNFISALATVRSYKVEKNNLIMISEGKTVMKFSR